MSGHEVQILTSPRHGCWGFCICGWKTSVLWKTGSGVHLEFGRHLLDVAHG